MWSFLHQNVLGRYYTNSNNTMNYQQVTRSREKKISIPAIGGIILLKGLSKGSTMLCNHRTAGG